MPATLPTTDTEQLEAYARVAGPELARAVEPTRPAARRRRGDRMGYVLVAPYVLHLLVFFGYPLLFSLVLIFHRWDVVTPMEFVGLKNFVRLFQDDLFFRSILNTGLFLSIHIPLQIGLALFFAELLNTKLAGLGFFRTVYFLPVVVSGVVVTILFQQLFAFDTGFINGVLTAMGGERVPWLVSPAWAMPSIALMATWKNAGLYVILFLAGLQNIPASLYEVAELEGASTWQRWWLITLPMLNPMVVTVVVLSTIGGFSLFIEPYVLTGGGPGNATTFLSQFLATAAVGRFDLGPAAAFSIIYFLFILLFSWLFYTAIMRIQTGER